jgi:hypothetical protein
MEVLGCDEVDVEVLGFGEGTFSVVNSTFFSVRWSTKFKLFFVTRKRLSMSNFDGTVAT